MKTHSLKQKYLKIYNDKRLFPLNITDLENKIFSIDSDEQFNQLTLEVFKFQYKAVEVYQKFCNYLNACPSSVTSVSEIPFLPISFFKTNTIISKQFKAELVFESSGTTDSKTSKHFVAKEKIYRQSFLDGFKAVYGNPKEYCIIGLLPSYLEKGNSSLVYMVNELIQVSENQRSGFYLKEYDKLRDTLIQNEEKKQKTIIFGVSYALLDFIEKYTFSLEYTTIIETGGMKGRRKEMIREELHLELKRGFGLNQIHSEYGMTELLSQAYLTHESIFKAPKWMKVLVREIEAPLSLIKDQNIGGLNVIDLANIYSCSFVATQDLAKRYSDREFEVLGRFDDSDIRGCNLMVS